jgi:ornithine carbamoyltransferase
MRGVPVWNGLTDEWHPTQALCDSVTMLEHARKPAGDIAFAYIGDARFNMGNSLLAVGALLGMDVRIVAPPSLQPAPGVVAAARDVADGTGARLTVTDDLAGVEGVDFVHTDVWVSMGEPKDVWAERIELLAPYQVNARLMERTGNPAARLMHCLPAYHDLGTAIGREIPRRIRAQRAGSDRRRVRRTRVDRLRPGREPDAQHQGGPRRNAGGLTSRRLPDSDVSAV